MSAAKTTQLREEFVSDLFDAHSATRCDSSPPHGLAGNARLDHLRALERRGRGILTEASATANSVLSD